MKYRLTTVSPDGRSVSNVYDEEELTKFNFLFLAATMKSLTIEPIQ